MKAKKEVQEIQGTKQEFLKVFREMCYSRSAWQVWADLISMIACSLANSTDPDKAGVRYLEREQEYKQCAERLGGVDKPSRCMAVIVEALERNPEQDFLGELFMELKLGNHWKGQFFTPYCVCKAMSNMVTGDVDEQIEQRGYIDLSESAQMINTSIVTALSSTEGIDMSGFTASMQSSITSSIEGLDYSGVTTAVGSGISNAITATMGTIQGAIDTLYSNVGSAINTAFSAGFSTTTTVTITANYKLANPSATISFSGGGTGTATVSGSISSHANGGFAYGPELTWWGEDGPEVIIPLGSKRRQRGLELWAQAGEMLGVGKHADGGIIGSGGGTSKNIWDNTERLIEPISEGDSGTSDVSTVIDSERNSDTKEVNLSVTVNPQFVISSTSQREDDILQIIKTHMKELADDLGGELADRLGEVFSNMPISS